MPKYLFAYHGGSAPETPAEGEQVMVKWQGWFEGLGNNVVDGGNPVMQSWTVSASGVEDNGGANPLSGYSIVEAQNIEAAIEMAKGCPILEDETGSVEVAEIHEM